MSELKEREQRKFWAICDGGCVKHEIGYSCAPNNPNSWWFPSLGYSLTEGFHIFDTEKEANTKLLANLEKEAAKIADNIEAVKLRLTH